MDEIFETFGQAILTVLASGTIIAISTALFYHQIIDFIGHMLRQLI